jgi:hypothetical protein
MIFVGEKRSKTAIKMGVRWNDGRLAAKQLFDALNACGVNPRLQVFVNWWKDNGFVNYDTLVFLSRVADETPVIAMGRKVHKALEQAGISHYTIVHPAARGKIRNKKRYARHVRDVLGLVRSPALD